MGEGNSGLSECTVKGVSSGRLPPTVPVRNKENLLMALRREPFSGDTSRESGGEAGENAAPMTNSDLYGPFFVVCLSSSGAGPAETDIGIDAQCQVREAHVPMLLTVSDTW